jgi:hypothetical protein
MDVVRRATIAGCISSINATRLALDDTAQHLHAHRQLPATSGICRLK